MENSTTPQKAVELIRVIDPRNYDDVLKIVASIKEQVGEEIAHAYIGIICGSGFGPIGDKVQNLTILPYSNIPGFQTTSVEGHKGNMIFGILGGKKVVCLQGRFHPYEHNMNLALCAMPVRVMHLLGIKIMIVSNAAGGINSKVLRQGELMLIKDHIFLPGLAGFSPLVGCNDPRFGPKFVSVQEAYDKELRQLAMEVGRRNNLNLHESVYAMVGGSQYESPAEVRLLKTLGADAVGMSTCHEVIVARQCGIKVLGFSLITNIYNLDLDQSVEVCHDEVMDMAQSAGERGSSFLASIVQELHI